MPTDDADLIRAFQQGDRAAFETLYERHKDWVVRLAYRFCGHREDALDVLQDAFAYVLKKLPTLVLTARFTTFLYPAVKHLAFDRKRARGRLAPLPEGVEPWAGIEPDVREHFEGLSATQQEILTLRFADGFDLKDIAAILKVPLGTVKSRLHHALNALRKKL